MEIFPICTASYKPNELCNVCSPIIAQQSFPWQYKMQFRQITAVFWFCNTLACITSHWQIKILLLILVSWPKAVVSFVLSFNLVCLFGDAFSDKMPGALHTRQVLEALQHYGHFSTALKNIKTDRSLFTAYPPFLQWHHVLQCCNCFILLSHHRKGSFSLLTSDVKAGEKTLFLLKNRNCVEL